jgi:hypothetical protein
MITITKDKIYRSNFSLKKTRPDSESVEEIEVKEVIFSMGEDVELGEDVTFERIFDMIIFHKEFFNILFNAEMSGLEVDDFISDYEQEFDLIHPHQEYKLRLSWAGVVYELDHEVEFYDQTAFEAFGKLDTRIDGDEYPISLAFSSLSEFRKKLVIFDNTFEIQNERSYQNELEVDFKANYRPFTLSHLIGTILEEISHYGTPEDRELARKEMERRSKEINDWINEGNLYESISESNLREEFGEMMEEEYPDDDNITFWDKLYPSDKPKGKSSKEVMDDAMIAMSEEDDNLSLEEMLKEADEAEDYERAAKIKKLIEKRDQRKKK